MGVKPGERIVTDNIVKDMKQYFIIKIPKALNDIEDIKQLEREYQVIMAAGEHINLIRKEEYHTEHNIFYMALDFAIATCRHRRRRWNVAANYQDSRFRDVSD